MNIHKLILHIQLAYRNLLRSPRRTLSVLLTVAFGSGALLLFDGFNTGIMNQYRANTIRARYGHGQLNTIGYRDRVFERPWEHWISSPEPLLLKLKSIPGVDFVFPRVEFYGLLTHGEISLSGKGQGIDAAAEAGFFTTLNVEEGKMITGEENGAILGKGLARSLNAQVGDRIIVLAQTVYGSLNAVEVTVVGIFHTGAKDFDDTVFRMPLKLSQQLLDTTSVETIALGLSPIAPWSRIAEEAKGLDAGLEATPFEILDKIYYQNAVDFLAAQFGFIRLIILLIVVLGILNTISVSIFERKQEVGYLRANGERRSDVFALFLFEGLLLGITGAVVGIASVFLLNTTVLANGILMPPSPGLTRQFRVMIELDTKAAAYTFMLGVMCALFGTALASLRVVRMSIAEALRST